MIPERRWQPVAAAVLVWAATVSVAPVRLCSDHDIRHVEAAESCHDAGITELADRLSHRIATDVPALPSVVVTLDQLPVRSHAPLLIPSIAPLGRDPPARQSRAPPIPSL
jgi:hypothetical protein